jgi:hypothetical protein
MKHIKTLALLVSTLCLSHSAFALETASLNEVLSKYDQARNLEKIKTIKTMRSEASMRMNGMELPMTFEYKAPNQARMDSTIQGMTITQVIDGNAGWKTNPMLGKPGPQPLTKEEREALALMTNLEGDLSNYQAKGHKLLLQGEMEVSGAPAYKLQLTKSNGDVEYHYIDTENYLLVRLDRQMNFGGTKVDSVTTTSDFKPINGMMWPHSMEAVMKTPMGELKSVMTVKSTQFDNPIDAARFSKPATE